MGGAACCIDERKILRKEPKSLLKNPEFVIPNEVREVRNLSFLGILIEEGFIVQKTCDAKSYLASLGMAAIGILQQSAKPENSLQNPKFGTLLQIPQN